MQSFSRAVGGFTVAMISVALVACGPRTPDGRPPAHASITDAPGVESDKVYSAQPGDEGPRLIDVQNDTDGQRRTYTVDAMIGQINGKPIYATDIFEAVGTETLARLGASQPRMQFRQRVSQLLGQKLQQMVFDALLLAEAESSLSEQQQQGLLGMLRKFREERMQEIIYNDGPRSDAAQQRTIEERVARDVEERRQQLIIQKHLRDKIFPKVDVSRREVERYYRNHPGEFNPPGKVTLRLILVRDEAAAEAVAADLEAGKAFGDVAGEHSTYRPAEGGLMTFEARISDFDDLSWPKLNEAIRGLSAGEDTGRVDIDGRVAWAYLESYEAPESRSLNEVWLEIEKKLRSQEFERAQRQYMGELMERGNFTPMEQMLQTLISVAVNRFAQAE